MATSSIFANIKITEPEKVEAFVDALKASINIQIKHGRIYIMPLTITTIHG